MATYPKKLKSLEIHLMLDGATESIADTTADDKAARALNEFKNYETMELENGKMIPYHAVQYIKVTETDGSIEKADAYGCDE